MQTQLKWYAIFCSSILMVFLCYYFGILHELYQTDFTKLSWVIIAIFFAMSIALGYKLHKKDVRTTDFEWFVAESMLSIGMVGTVIGFIYMLTTIFTGLDVQQVATVQQALSDMATGMGTALWTTLVGLIFSIIYKTQLVLVDEASGAK